MNTSSDLLWGDIMSGLTSILCDFDNDYLLELLLGIGSENQ